MFSVVFPRLISKHVLAKVRILITDEDPQDFSQVDNAIESMIPNAKRVQCGWHIVHKGFDKYIDTAVLQVWLVDNKIKWLK